MPAPDQPGRPRQSIATLLTTVVADAGGLVLDEARLARAETAENIRGLGRAAALVAAGALFIGMALVFVTVAAVVALSLVMGLLWSLLLVTLAAVLIGWLLLHSGKVRLAAAKLLPDRTLSRMAADLSWLADRDRNENGKREETRGE